MTEQIKIDFEKTIKTSDFSKSEAKFKESFLNKFIAKGFPSKKSENWKFSDINQIIQKNIGELSFYNDYSSSSKIDTSIFIDELEHNKIVFVNGRVEKIDFTFEDKNKIEISEDSEPKDKLENNNSLIDLNSAFTNKSYNSNYIKIEKHILFYRFYICVIHIKAQFYTFYNYNKQNYYR